MKITTIKTALKVATVSSAVFISACENEKLLADLSGAELPEVDSSGLDSSEVELSEGNPEAPEAPLPALPESDSWWQPTADQPLTWQWQLQGEIDTSFDVDVYNLDIDAPVEVIQELKSRGVTVICYFSAGTVEAWRPDAELFPESIIGEQYEDLYDERWIDYGNYEVFADVMRARMDTCKAKGFDAIETDNVDGHNFETRDENDNVVNIGTNFLISVEESTNYIRWLADEAHSRGLSIGLKNAEEMAPAVVGDVDWMLTEDCYVDNWCQYATIFIENNKPVFMTEYEDLLPDFTPACELAKAYGFFAIWRDPGLSDGVYLACE